MTSYKLTVLQNTSSPKKYNPFNGFTGYFDILNFITCMKSYRSRDVLQFSKKMSQELWPPWKKNLHMAEVKEVIISWEFGRLNAFWNKRKNTGDLLLFYFVCVFEITSLASEILVRGSFRLRAFGQYSIDTYLWRFNHDDNYDFST